MVMLVLILARGLERTLQIKKNTFWRMWLARKEKENGEEEITMDDNT